MSDAVTQALNRERRRRQKRQPASVPTDTQNATDTRKPARMVIFDAMNSSFTQDEIEAICFELLIDDEALKTQTKPAFIRALIKHVIDTYNAQRFVRILRRMRPAIEWPSASLLTTEQGANNP